MSISTKDSKILWGRAGGICSICKRPLTEGEADSKYLLGEQAHIIAESLNGPRGNSMLSISERNSYSNLILLCSIDHKRIDKNPNDWPVNRLHSIKNEHENWVTQSLNLNSNKTINAFLDYLLSTVTNLCNLNDWSNWNSQLIQDNAKVEKHIVNNIYYLNELIDTLNWPVNQFKELKVSTMLLSSLLLESIQKFMQHVTDDDNYFYIDKYYKRTGGFYNNPNHNAIYAQYENWLDDW